MGIQQITDLNETPIPLWRIPMEEMPKRLWDVAVASGTHVVIRRCEYEIKAFSLAWNAYIASKVQAA